MVVFPVYSNKGTSLSIISKVSMDARGERSERKNAPHLERLTGLESTFRVWSQGGGVLGRASHLSLNDAEMQQEMGFSGKRVDEVVEETDKERRTECCLFICWWWLEKRLHAWRVSKSPGR